MRQTVPLLVVASALCVGCPKEEAASKEESEPRASADLTSTSAAEPLEGRANFFDDGKVTVILANAPPGKHGVHIHENGSCAPNDAGAAGAAGGHWNPTSEPHGGPSEASHLGDLGNIEVAEDGRGTLSITKSQLEVGGDSPNNVIGKALVIHADEDDLETQPSGASGARIACGVIQ